jgi:sarcosine oxidase subunit gamma
VVVGAGVVGAGRAEHLGRRNGAGGRTRSERYAVLVARLGSSEFFLEDREGGATLRNLDPAVTGSPATYPAGVYPVLRQDAAFLLSGEGSLDVLAQVCNVNFGELALESNPVIMTLMVGVAVLVIPQVDQGARQWGARQFKIWCDPTLGRIWPIPWERW